MVNSQLNVVQLVPHIGKIASGYSYTVPRVCRVLRELGHSVRLITSDGETDDLDDITAVTKGAMQIGSGLIGLPNTLKQTIFSAGKECDLLHSNSLWRMTSIYPAWAASKFNKPYIISPRGTLSDHAKQIRSLPKSIFSYAFQQRALEAATLFHVTSEGEYFDLRACGVNKPIAVIPNGVEIPVINDSDFDRERKTLLYLGRIHPIKGLEMLVDCWRKLAIQYPEWEMRIVGPLDSAYAHQLKDSVLSALVPRIVFLGGKSGYSKVRELQAADVLVLPSKSENFGMVVAEALSSGTPVITTTGTPWAGVTTNNCGWWVDRREDRLLEALADAMSADGKALREMGGNGRAWMMRDYSWERVVKDMINVYKWLCFGGNCPGCVLDC